MKHKYVKQKRIFSGFSHCKCKALSYQDAEECVNGGTVWYAMVCTMQGREVQQNALFWGGIAYKQCINGILWRFLYT